MASPGISCREQAEAFMQQRQQQAPWGRAGGNLRAGPTVPQGPAEKSCLLQQQRGFHGRVCLAALESDGV